LKICSDAGDCSLGEVRFFIIKVNDGPYTQPDNVTVESWEFIQNIDVLANDIDVDSPIDYDTLAVVDPPSHGEAWVDVYTSTIMYQPFVRYHGSDQFSYVICDTEKPEIQKCSTENVYITVEQKCFACNKCASWISGFNFHTDKVSKVFETLL
jgi:hypothetical protein